ncbi:hypothetical protein FA014_09540 [Cellulomonas hominis]|uniref:Uncharacterized protein n=1 Tax=Cellulomonas hominis TaxID=156981 RepID=A0A7Z8NPG4_9CELL|nr:hypothetical protein [Cellulomonas hominis]TKR23765.1 hypothetical protein FA014_09540 [Cellulomonas hominis]
MTSSLGEAATVLAVAVVATGYLLVVGAPLRLVLERVARPVRGLGPTLGLGLAATAVVVTPSYVLAGDAVLPVLPLAGAALVVLAVLALLEARPSRGRRRLGRMGAWRALLPTRWDAVALAATVVVLAPLLAHGLVYWTALANDFPNYAASADVWIADSGHGAAPFLDTHPDPFGAFQVNRAGYEKPMVTAMLVAVSVVTRTPAAALLAPMVAVSFFALVATLLPLVARTLRIGTATATLVVLVPTFSILPMSRVFDAQLGQTVAVALVAVLLAVLVAPPRGPGAARRALHGVVAGALAAATVGSNATLVLGTGVGTVALLGWLVAVRGQAWRPVVRTTAVAALVAIAVSVPVLGWYASSLRNQTTGEVGYEIPLASPLALIGMQVDLRSAPPLGQALVGWGVLTLAGALGYLAWKRHRPGIPATGALICATAANGALIVLVNGFTGYSTHKWLAVVVALIVPFVLARLATLVPAAARRWSTAFLAALAAGSTALAVVAATTVPVVVPAAAFGLADDSRLQLDAVNVRLGDIYQDSLVPLLLPADRVVAAGRTYAQSGAPIGSTFLLPARDAEVWPTTRSEDLAGEYVLAEVDLALGAGTVAFSAEHPATERFLYGRWGELEGSGVWSTGRSTRVVFDVADELRGADLVLTLTGARFADAAQPRELRVVADGDVVAEHTFRSAFATTALEVPVPTELVEAGDGRVALTLETPAPLSPADVGQEDTRTLAYWLASISLRSLDAPEQPPGS